MKHIRKKKYKIVCMILAVISALLYVIWKLKKKVSFYRGLSDKHFEMFSLMNEWIWMKRDGKSIEDYLSASGIMKIGIYGMNYIGKTLCHELNGTGISVKCGIDKRDMDDFEGVPIILPDDRLREYDLDAVVVTPIGSYYSIEDELEQTVSCPILSLERMVNDINNGMK